MKRKRKGRISWGGGENVDNHPVHTKVEELYLLHAPIPHPQTLKTKKGNKSVSHLLKKQTRLTVGSLQLDSHCNSVQNITCSAA